MVAGQIKDLRLECPVPITQHDSGIAACIQQREVHLSVAIEISRSNEGQCGRGLIEVGRLEGTVPIAESNVER